MLIPVDFHLEMYLEVPNHSLMRHVALLLEAHPVHPQHLVTGEEEGSQEGVSLLLCGMHHRSAAGLHPR